MERELKIKGRLREIESGDEMRGRVYRSVLL